MTTTPSRTFARVLALSAAFVLTTSLFSIATPSARAVTATPTPNVQVATRTAAPAPTTAPRSTFASRIVATAASRRGKPYVYGAAGPNRFDCSGLTMWTFKKLGRRLPHSSSAQYGRTKHLRARDRRPGDLVFFHDRGGIYHVGIYAGKNTIWHAPYSGARVRKERIWTSAVYYGRVR